VKFLAVLGLSVALLSGCSGATTAQPVPTVTVTQEVPAPTVTITRIPADDGSGLRTEFKVGEWIAGQDIQAGTYKTAKRCSGLESGYFKTDAARVFIPDITVDKGGFVEITVKNGEIVTVGPRCGLWVRQS